MRHILTAACTLALSGGAALAQPAETAAAADAEAGAAAEASASVSDDELLRFGRAVVRIQEINAAPAGSLADEARQAALAAAVTDAGLEVAEFNRIGEAVGGDAALQARVVTLLQADQAAAAAPAAAQ